MLSLSLVGNEGCNFCVYNFSFPVAMLFTASSLSILNCSVCLLFVLLVLVYLLFVLVVLVNFLCFCASCSGVKEYNSTS